MNRSIFSANSTNLYDYFVASASVVFAAAVALLLLLLLLLLLCLLCLLCLLLL